MHNIRVGGVCLLLLLLAAALPCNGARASDRKQFSIAER